MVRGPALSVQARALLFLRTLPDHRLIDRLVRGRSWIPVLGVLLAGIVAMQVELLKLNASIGRSINLSSGLQSRNELLRTSISSLSDPQRIEHLAAGLGMVMPGPTSILFLNAGHGSAAEAAANIHAPDPSVFQASLTASADAAQAGSNGVPATETSTANDPSSPQLSSTSPGTPSSSVSPATPSSSASPATPSSSASPTTPSSSAAPTSTSPSSVATVPPTVPPSGSASPGVSTAQSPTGSP